MEPVAQRSRRSSSGESVALWALVIVAFFSFSTRQEYYTIPAIPALALLVGGWLAKESDAVTDSAARRAGRISSAVLLAIVAAGSVVGVVLLVSSRAPAPGLIWLTC